MNEYYKGIAKRFIESKYPDVRGPLKIMLILVFCAGVEWGRKEAADILDTEVKQMRIEWGIKK